MTHRISTNPRRAKSFDETRRIFYACIIENVAQGLHPYLLQASSTSVTGSPNKADL
jgi:hypothetical protein